MERADRYVGEFETDDLVYDASFPMLTKGVTLRAGQGLLKRGTLLAISGGTAGTGEVVVLGAAAVENETLEIYGVLTDDKDTGTDASGEAVAAEAYVTGKYNANKILVADGHTLSAADECELRKLGIFLATKMPL